MGRIPICNACVGISESYHLTDSESVARIARLTKHRVRKSKIADEKRPVSKSRIISSCCQHQQQLLT